MKLGDLVKRKKIVAATPVVSDKEIAIILDVKESEQQFVDDDGLNISKACLIKVMFLKTNKIHLFPEHYLELISEA